MPNVHTNLSGSSAVQDGLDVKAEIAKARITDAGLALHTDAQSRLGTSLSETNQKDENVTVRRADPGFLNTEEHIVPASATESLTMVTQSATSYMIQQTEIN